MDKMLCPLKMVKRRVAQKMGSLDDTVENPGSGQEMSRTFHDLRSRFGTSNKTRPFHCLDQWRSFARKFARKFQSERTCLSFCFAVAVVVCLWFFSLTKAGVHLKAVFTPLKISLILSDVSRSRFKQYLCS